MSSVETVQERVVDEYGNIRSEEQGYMHGGDVFNFVIREIPKDIKALLAYAEVDKDEFDYIIIDECHHATAETYKKIIAYFDQFLSCQKTETEYR